MINKITNNPMPGFIDKTADKAKNSKAISNNADATLQVNYADLISKALEKQQVDNDFAVQQAKELLNSGKLDSPENIKAAANAIADFGI